MHPPFISFKASHSYTLFTTPCILPSLLTASIFFPISLSYGTFSTFHYHSLTVLSFWTPLVYLYRCLFQSLFFLPSLKLVKCTISSTHLLCFGLTVLIMEKSQVAVKELKYQYHSLCYPLVQVRSLLH